MAKIIALWAMLWLPVAAQPSGDPVGAVLELKGHVYFRANPGAPEQPLSDPNKALSLGFVLHCGPDGSVTFWLRGETHRLKPNEKYTITWVPNSAQSKQMAKVQDALKGYSRAGASERGEDDSFLLAPASDSVVMPGRFTIRWTPVEGAVTFQLRAGERSIWHDTVNDGSSGVLESEPARQAVASAGSGPFTLAASSAAGTGEVSFSVLSADGQSELENELKFWQGQESSFLRRIGRASVYANRRMFAEAAGEYEAALGESPDSADLLRATLRAEKRAGNLARARQLQTRVPAAP